MTALEVFEDQEEGLEIDKTLSRVEIHTDGSVLSNIAGVRQVVGGAAYLIILKNKNGDILEFRNGAVASIDMTNSSRNELVAIIEALQTITTNPCISKFERKNLLDLRIFSDNDCSFVSVFKNNCEKVLLWKSLDWIKPNGTPVVFKSEYITLLNLFYLIQETGIYNTIGINKVATHSNRTGNEMADTNARRVVTDLVRFQQPDDFS